MEPTVTFVHHDTSDLDRLDEAFAAKRLAEAAAIRAAAHGELARKAGIGALLGGLGVGATLFGLSFLVAPKPPQIVQVHDKETTIKEVPGPERVVTKEVPVFVTKAEHDFVSRPEYESAQFKGRLIADPDGQIRFDTGSVFVPVKPDPASGHWVQDPDAMYEVTRFLGDWAFCNEIPASDHRFKCEAIDHDVIVDLSTTYKLKPKRSSRAGRSFARDAGKEVLVQQVLIERARPQPVTKGTPT